VENGRIGKVEFGPEVEGREEHRSKWALWSAFHCYEAPGRGSLPLAKVDTNALYETHTKAIPLFREAVS